MKAAWMLKYGRIKCLPHHMNYILVEVWDSFKVSDGNAIRYSLKKSYPPIPLGLTRNKQELSDSIQISSGDKSEEINRISRHKVAPIEVHVTRTGDNMVVL